MPFLKSKYGNGLAIYKIKNVCAGIGGVKCLIYCH
jgi:hypothetical protein